MQSCLPEILLWRYVIASLYSYRIIILERLGYLYAKITSREHCAKKIPFLAGKNDGKCSYKIGCIIQLFSSLNHTVDKMLPCVWYHSSCSSS